MELKTDSYALETNIHFPTDLNLLWDSIRKGFDTIDKLRKCIELTGWRKIKDLRSSIKNQFRSTTFQVFKGKKEGLKKQSVRAYLEKTRDLVSCFEAVLNMGVIEIKSTSIEKQIKKLLNELKKYTDYCKLFMDQIKRRLLLGEEIPTQEKVYSIFEEHTEWINKGKFNKRVELGHLILITTDQNHLIVDYKVLEDEKDATQINSLLPRIKEKYQDKKIKSHSFDKGFWSKDNFNTLQKEVEEVILPKRGKKNVAEKERENSNMFKKLRNKHSAIESNINQLEHHGLNRCYDKGIKGFKRSVGLSVLAYNLHRIGNQLIKLENAAELLKRKKYKVAV